MVNVNKVDKGDILNPITTFCSITMMGGIRQYHKNDFFTVERCENDKVIARDQAQRIGYIYVQDFKHFELIQVGTKVDCQEKGPDGVSRWITGTVQSTAPLKVKFNDEWFARKQHQFGTMRKSQHVKSENVNKHWYRVENEEAESSVNAPEQEEEQESEQLWFYGYLLALVIFLAVCCFCCFGTKSIEIKITGDQPRHVKFEIGHETFKYVTSGDAKLSISKGLEVSKENIIVNAPGFKCRIKGASDTKITAHCTLIKDAHAVSLEYGEVNSGLFPSQTPYAKDVDSVVLSWVFDKSMTPKEKSETSLHFERVPIVSSIDGNVYGSKVSFVSNWDNVHQKGLCENMEILAVNGESTENKTFESIEYMIESGKKIATFNSPLKIQFTVIECEVPNRYVKSTFEVDNINVSALPSNEKEIEEFEKEHNVQSLNTTRDDEKKITIVEMKCNQEDCDEAYEQIEKDINKKLCDAAFKYWKSDGKNQAHVEFRSRNYGNGVWRRGVLEKNDGDIVFKPYRHLWDYDKTPIKCDDGLIRVEYIGRGCTKYYRFWFGFWLSIVIIFIGIIGLICNATGHSGFLGMCGETVINFCGINLWTLVNILIIFVGIVLELILVLMFRKTENRQLFCIDFCCVKKLRNWWAKVDKLGYNPTRLSYVHEKSSIQTLWFDKSVTNRADDIESNIAQVNEFDAVRYFNTSTRTLHEYMNAEFGQNEYAGEQYSYDYPSGYDNILAGDVYYNDNVLAGDLSTKATGIAETGIGMNVLMTTVAVYAIFSVGRFVYETYFQNQNNGALQRTTHHTRE